MFQGLTGWHAVIILAIILLLFGAPKLPGLAKSLGQSMKIFKAEVKTPKDEEAEGTGAESSTGTASSTSDGGSTSSTSTSSGSSTNTGSSASSGSSTNTGERAEGSQTQHKP